MACAYVCEGEMWAAREAAPGEILHVDDNLSSESEISVGLRRTFNGVLEFLKKLAKTRNDLWGGHPGLSSHGC